MPLLVKNLNIEYPGKVLFKDLQVEIEDQKIVAVRTEVLDGGTTLLKGLAGMLDGIDGEVRLDGIDLLHMDPAQRALKVGYVYEQQGLVSLYDCFQNIALPLQFHTTTGNELVESRIFSLCEKFNVDRQILNEYPHALNDVQCRMINLLRALVIEPKLLLIDELEGGMSERVLGDTIDTLREEQKNNAMIVIITTADDLLLDQADYSYQIENNKLRECH
ncbi:MAG: ATP-binding cassette domain-containing protein [Gammaproteobacteria bacterium]|jgi:ABC-type lipoprotein export system ATPase subunit|nr:ATP-binding cassette domain-containing protein [Gammaproteobacteria bacterium]MBT5202477.1 ATP-binding cassette domain-containing protein [Gammaproteobacteria bacterium]MBT5601901.1 ATP-binding cassette domain-containing protein [Gammaproteobacteria bacterium]MBT6246615.1 ATP-binding cassette domain-containing protein [Gammaproteobacteria bacterium]